MAFYKELTRIRSNIEEALVYARHDKLLATGNERSEGHFLLINQNFETQLYILDFAERLISDPLPTAQLNYVSIWLDIHFWITKFACFYERTVFMINKSSAFADLLGENFTHRANSIIGLNIILSRFLETSATTSPPLIWIQDEQLMRSLVDFVKSIYVRFFSTLEEIIISNYSELVEKDKISRAETDLTELLALCNQISLPELQKNNTLIATTQTIEKIKKKVERMARKEHPLFARIIPHMIGIFLPEQERKTPLNHWMFFLHARNSLLHKEGWGTADCEIELWGRSYKIEKDKPFVLYSDSSFPILAFRLMEIFVDLALSVANETALRSDWTGVKTQYLVIRTPE